MNDFSTLNKDIFLNGYANSGSLKLLHSAVIKDPISQFPLDGSNLTIVVLSFNRVSCTIRLINSIVDFIPGFKGEVLLIDNGSVPDQLQLLEDQLAKIKSFRINLVKLEKNYGVAGARNKAIEFVRTDWFMSLDNDIYLISNPLPSIKNCIEKLNVLFLNVPLLQADKKTVDAFGGNLWIEPYEDTYFISGTSTFRQLPVSDIPKLDSFVSTFLYGGASVINKQAFIDNDCYEGNMFIGFEDTELSLRLTKKGIKIGNATSFSFIHAHEAPTNIADADAEKARFSADRIRESSAYFKEKHGLMVWKPSVGDWINERFRDLNLKDPGEAAIELIEQDRFDLAMKFSDLSEFNNGETLPLQTMSVERELIELKEKLKHAEYTIRMMETSKFWAVRNFWFKQRRKLGLSDDGVPFSLRKLKIKKSIHSKKHVTAPYNYNKLLNNLPDLPTGSSVLVFVPFMVVGGAETAILHVLKGFKNNNIHVTLIVSNHPVSDNMGNTAEEFLKICQDVYVLEDYENLWNDPDKWKHWKNLTSAIIKQRNIDNILISNSSFAYTLLPELKNEFPNVRVINPVYSIAGHMVDNIKYEPFIDLTVVENPLVESYLLKECLRNSEKVKRIENGVDIKKYKPTPKKTLNRKINGISIPDHKKVITFLGRLSEEKAPDIFLKIAQSIKDDHEVHFILSGDGPMWAQLMEMKSSWQMENITFTGFADSKEVLAISDILLLPSRIDGRPNVVLESLAMGVPVIASNVGGLPWIISSERKNGMICEAGNILEFKNAITNLCNDLNRLNEFKKFSRIYAEEQLDVQYMQSAYLNICKANIKN